MKSLAATFTAGTLLAAVFVPVGAGAADLTFNVPVDISGFPPEIYQLVLECRTEPITELGANGTAVVKLTNGAFKGTVTVPVDVSGPKLLTGGAKVTGYTCLLSQANATLAGKVVVVALTNGGYSTAYTAPADPKQLPVQPKGALKLTPKP